MALTLTVDYRLRQLVEPGTHQFVSSRDLAGDGWPEDEESHQGFWADPITQTLMLKPLQLRDDWLDTPQAGPAIIRLAQMVTNPTDISSGAVKEQPAFGNPDNPWIYHNPVGPSAAFPTAPNPMPGAGPTLNGVNMGDDVSGMPLLSVHPPEMYIPSPTMPAFNALPTPTVAGGGGASNSKVIAYSVNRTEPNQALFFRWFRDDGRTGYSGMYWFYVAQYAILIKGVTLELYEDISEAGNRTSWKKLATWPMWDMSDAGRRHTGSYVDFSSPRDPGNVERNLLWLPFRRNEVLLASNAHSATFKVNGRARRLADNTDWDITRSDTIGFRVLTRTPGRFQVQQVVYTTNSPIMQAPPYKLDYTPGFTPVVTIDGDHDHGTTLSTTITAPPGYTIPKNSASDCPTDVTNTTDQSRSYGVKLHMHTSADARWTPFFYGYSIDAARVFGNSTATEVTVGENSPGLSLTNVKITAGLTPGEGRLTCDIVDPSPYDLSSKYYHSGMPLKLDDSVDGTLFVAISEPNEVTPLHGPSTSPRRRRVVMKGLDKMKLLTDTWLRDKRDYTGYGHIDVVRFICEQGGVELVSPELPPYTVGVPDGNYNQALGGSSLEKSVALASKEVTPCWQPKFKETAKDFINRIATHFSGWYWGFRLDGTFFYLPRNYFTTPSVTFHEKSTEAFPQFRDSVTFHTVEPEANVILVISGSAVDGAAQASSLWTDWGSVRNKNTVNYLGRFKREVVIVGGGLSCSQLNYVARRIWDQTRRRRINVEFQADFVPSLKVGQVFTLGAYGNYICVGFNADLKRTGRHYAAYQGEYIEKGYGLPTGGVPM